MVCLTRGIDFTTADAELSSIILEEFPGVIKGEQYEVKTANGVKVYTFKNINPKEMIKFLENIGYDLPRN